MLSKISKQKITITIFQQLNKVNDKGVSVCSSTAPYQSRRYLTWI